MQNKTLVVGGMSCGHCSQSVEKACLNLDGVKTVQVDLGTKQVKLEFEESKITLDKIKETIEDQGYDVIV